jgi:ABC-type nitrate/sulfonate/bicarbonate transport system permease component
MLIDVDPAKEVSEGVAFLFAPAAVPLGLFVGWFRVINAQLDPVIEVLRPIPPLRPGFR